jgi:hypothetical protein
MRRGNDKRIHHNAAAAFRQHHNGIEIDLIDEIGILLGKIGERRQAAGEACDG